MTTLKKILDFLNPSSYKGQKNLQIDNFVRIQDNQSINHISWCSIENSVLLKDKKIGTYIVDSEIGHDFLNNNCNYIFVDNPREAFMLALKEFFLKRLKTGIAPTAQINKNTSIGLTPSIGHNVIIEEGCIIGNNCTIDHNTVLKRNTKMGNNVIIGSNCTIGGAGFGYVRDKANIPQRIPHIGDVLIEDNVEVGNNTCIDRDALGSTILRQNSKIDNLVQIGHGVDVGENSIIAALAIIGGSTPIGKNSWVAPSSSIIDKGVVGENAFIGMGAVVLKEVEDNSVIVGNPGRVLRKNQAK